MNILIYIIKRELKLYFVKGGGNLSIVIFYIVISTLFSFAVGSNLSVLSDISSGIIWVCAILASTLSMNKMFEDDFEDGCLAQLMMQKHLPEIVVFAKIFSHWLATGLPLILTSPIIALMLDFSTSNITYLVISLLIGTANLSLIGAMVSSLTIGLKKNASLVSVLMLPLSIPTLIFGIYASEKINNQFIEHFIIILALFLILLPLSVITTCKSVKIAIEN